MYLPTPAGVYHAPGYGTCTESSNHVLSSVKVFCWNKLKIQYSIVHYISSHLSGETAVTYHKRHCLPRPWSRWVGTLYNIALDHAGLCPTEFAQGQGSHNLKAGSVYSNAESSTARISHKQETGMKCKFIPRWYHNPVFSAPLLNAARPI
jgi:hypothetical protein